MAVIELTPFLRGDLVNDAMRSRHWLMGGFPDGGARKPSAYPAWQSQYLRLVTERDLPELGMPSTPQATQRPIRMLAALDGQQWNASELGRSMGIDCQTAARSVDFIEGAFLVRRLPAFHANLRKRLVKSPKIHWRDTGLLHSRLGIRDERSLLSHPVAGPSWESHVVEQAIGLLLARGVRHEAFHFRSSDGYEIDLVLEAGSERWAIEIKLTSNPSPADFARLDRCAEMISATRRVLVSRTPSDAGDRRRLSCGIDRFLQELLKLKGWVRRPGGPISAELPPRSHPDFAIREQFNGDLRASVLASLWFDQGAGERETALAAACGGEVGEVRAAVADLEARSMIARRESSGSTRFEALEPDRSALRS